MRRSEERVFNEADFRDMSIRVLNIIMPSVFIFITAWMVSRDPDRTRYIAPIACLFLFNMGVSRLQSTERFRTNPWLTVGRFAVSFPMLGWTAWLSRESGYGWVFFLPHCFALPFSFLVPVRVFALLAWQAAAMAYSVYIGMGATWIPALASMLLVSAVSGSGAWILERNLGLIQQLPFQDRRKWGRVIGNQAVVSYVVLIAGVGLTLLLLKNEFDHRRKAMESKLRERAQTAVANMEIRLASQRSAVEAFAGFFEGSNRVDRKEFAIFANRLLLHMPSILAFEWIPKVDAKDRLRFETETALEAGRDYRIFKPDSGSTAPVPDPGFLLPIRFVEPFDRYRSAWGMDIRFSPDRAACAEKALSVHAYVVCRPAIAEAGRPGEDLAFAFIPVEKPALSGLVVALLSQTKVALLAHRDILLTGMAVGVDFQAGADRFPIMNSGPANGETVLEQVVNDSGGGGYLVRISAPRGMLATEWTIGDFAFVFMGVGMSIMLAYFLFHTGKASLPLEIKVLERTDELRRVVLRVEEANQAKTRFLAHMSHEIRTPLHGVLGLSQALLRTNLSPASRESLDLIHASGLSLMGIVNDALDVSKIESGKLVLDAKPFPICKVLEEIVGTFRSEADAKGVKLSIRAESELPGFVTGDRLRFRQILANLIGNAVKFTDKGSVTVLTAFSAPDRFRVRIVDTGVGISPAKLERLFQPFEQGDASTTSRFGGTGLGLVISLQLARKMSGDIQVRSREGAGTEFEVALSLPAASAPAPQAEKDQPPLRKGGRLLLAEDNKVNVKVALALLSDYFETIDVAANGKEALDMLSASAYDLILMDIRMPVMGGVEAAREIRKNPGWSGIPIVALTANAFSSDHKECRDAGMDDFLEKPITRQALYALLGRYLGAASG